MTGDADGPEGKLKRIAARLRQQGPAWVLRRLRHEVREPSTAAGRRLRRTIAAVDGNLARRRGGASAQRWLDDDTLLAVYDLDVMPPSYDMATFLALAELERRQRHFARIHVLLVPGRHLDSSPDPSDPVTPAARRMRLDAILLPMLRLLPSCAGHILCASRQEALALTLAAGDRLFPRAYNPRVPDAPDLADVRRPDLASARVFPLLRAPEHERSLITEALIPRLAGRLPIVVSLRQYDFMPARNSSLKDWIAFADRLDPQRFAAVFVRDTEVALAPSAAGLERHIVLEAASWHVGVRMALYEAAHINMAIMHGPMELCWYNDACRYVAFMPVGTSPQTSRAFLARRGFVEGRSLPFAGPAQRLAWRPDALADIEAEFQEILTRL